MASAAELEALRRARATGALKVRFADGREVTYRSLADLTATIALLESEQAGKRRVSTVRITTSKGL